MPNRGTGTSFSIAGTDPVRLLLIGILVFGLLFRLYAAFTLKQGLSYDESISYLCSAANQATYAETVFPITEERLTAGGIQQFYATPELQYGTVARDMATLDRHPPLYFWALHTVHHVLGFHLWDGLLLTIAASLGMLVLLVDLAGRLTGSWRFALFIGVVFYLSPAVVQMDLEARNYPFMGFFALAGLVLGHPLSQGRVSWLRVLLFTFVNLCGFLTHYYFGFLLLPGLLFTLRKNGFGRAFAIHLGTVLVSVLLFIMAFPGLFDFLEVYAQEPEADPSRTLWIKIRVFVYGWMGFFTAWHPGKHIAFWLSAVLVAYALVQKRIRKAIHAMLTATDERAYHAWYLLWCMAFTTLFYLGDISPAPATGEQYFAYFWPHFTLFGVLFIRALTPDRAIRIVAPTYVATSIVAFVPAVHASPYLRNVLPSDWYIHMALSEVVVTDEKRRSHLPRIALHLPADLPMIITDNPFRTLRELPQGNVTVLERGTEHDALLEADRAWPGQTVTTWTASYRHHALMHFQR